MVSGKSTHTGTFHKIPHFFDAIKFQESIFALPFAYTGMILAGKDFPEWAVVIWITIAMVSARTFGMIANRVIDRKIDSLNPRTRLRHLPQGVLSVSDLVFPGLISLLVFVICAWELNYLALWAGSFDILYHTQDVEFQRGNNLNSVAAKFGVPAAFKISKTLDIITVITLAYLGMLMSLHFIYFVGCLVVSLLLVYKYKMVKPDDLSKLGMAFMRINAFVSTTILIATIFAIVIG